MKFPKQAELSALLAKLQSQEALSAEEFQTMAQLNSELADWNLNASRVVDEIVDRILTYSVSYEQLMARPELATWKPAVVAAPAAAAPAGKTRRTRTPNPELVIFRIQPPGAKGAATLIHRGEIPLKMGAKLQWLLEQDGDLKDKLLATVDSTEAETFLANEEGQLFLEKILNWLRAQPSA